MTTHEVACRIDDNEVEHWDNEIHALMWHVDQANTADGFRDSGPGELVERIGREIIRRWLRDIPSSSTTTKAATTTGNLLQPRKLEYGRRVHPGRARDARSGGGRSTA